MWHLILNKLKKNGAFKNVCDVEQFPKTYILIFLVDKSNKYVWWVSLLKLYSLRNRKNSMFYMKIFLVEENFSLYLTEEGHVFSSSNYSLSSVYLIYGRVYFSAFNLFNQNHPKVNVGDRLMFNRWSSSQKSRFSKINSSINCKLLTSFSLG